MATYRRIIMATYRRIEGFQGSLLEILPVEGVKGVVAIPGKRRNAFCLLCDGPWDGDSNTHPCSRRPRRTPLQKSKTRSCMQKRRRRSRRRG